MSHDQLAGKARVSFKCSDELEQMIDAVSRYEHRSTSNVCRVALTHYFTHQGYFDEDMIAKLAKERKK
jgi:predicted transcriptional regulator